MNKEAIAIPVRIQYPQKEGLWKELVPGVRLLLYAGPISDLINCENVHLTPDCGHVIAPTHIILIKLEAYLSGVRERIEAEGLTIPDRVAEWVNPSDIARQCLMAATLSSRSTCSFASYYNLRRRGREWRCTGFSNRPLQKPTYTTLTALDALQPTPLKLNEIKQTALKLDRYYRAISWWTDRVGMALGYLWEGLCAAYPAQTYISLIALIDSLVGTKNSGGHSLAERVAIMLEKNPVSRKAVYTEIVSLYRVRNRLVHGSAHAGKGRQTTRTLIMGAKRSNVPTEEMLKLIAICIRIIKSALNDQTYLQIIQTKGSEDKISKQLDEFFLARLLDSSC